MKQYVKGLVSVVIPTFKRSEMLSRAVESVLNQSYTNIELLLVNDNEPFDKYTEELRERVAKYERDSRFHFIVQNRHINGAVARNVGIREAKGEYVALLDDDDWWETDKIEKQVNAFQTIGADYGVVSCKVKRVKGEKCFEAWPRYADGYVYKDILALRASYTTDSLLFRHTALDNVGYFDEGLFRHQDLQLLVNFTYQYKIYVVDEYLVNVDISDANNRPNPEKLIQAKKAFFESIKPIYLTLTPKEKRQVALLHRAEIGYIYLKNKQFVHAFKNMMCLITSPTSLKYEVQKVIEKKQSRDRAANNNTFA